MQQLKKKLIISLITLAILMIAIILPVLKIANAGIYTKEIVDDKSLSGKIDSAYWWQPSSNAGVAYNGGIEFSTDSKVNSRVITTERVQNLKDAGYDKCFAAEVDFIITSIPEGGRFGLFFGLSRQTETPAAGGANTTFLYFSYVGNSLQCGISNYVGTDKTETQILAPKATLSWISDRTAAFKVSLDVDVDGGITVYLIQGKNNNATAFYSNSKANVYTTGHIGFGQTVAGSAAKITKVLVQALANDTPDNTDIITRFENGIFNVNELYTRNSLYAGVTSYVKPENAGLVFKNTKNAYLSTMLSYSNFELELEIDDLQRVAVFDDDLNLVSSISTGFYITIGGSYVSGTPSDSAFYVHFEPIGGSETRKPTATKLTLVRGINEVSSVVLPAEYHLWGERASMGRGIDVKAVMDDGDFALSVKFRGEAHYYGVIHHDMGHITGGSIQIVSRVTNFLTGVSDNFSIGLLSITNTDYNRQIAILNNKDNSAEVYDYEYYDTWDDSDLVGNKL